MGRPISFGTSTPNHLWKLARTKHVADVSHGDEKAKAAKDCSVESKVSAPQKDLDKKNDGNNGTGMTQSFPNFQYLMYGLDPQEIIASYITLASIHALGG